MTDIDKIFEDFDFEEECEGFCYKDRTFWEINENSLNNKDLPIEIYRYISEILPHNKNQYKNNLCYISLTFKNDWEFGWMPKDYTRFRETEKMSGYDYYIKTGFKYMGEL